ncbi:hypothetical protein [Pseudoduganella sp. GCM10020061]|uniref:hypothetical protein n=1 Tax=Pseudoduganella sp. GCM10020061 TaxID=3317345 RepID=UPI00362C69D4
MKLRWIAAVAALAASSASMAQDFCAHRDTNSLVWNKAFAAEVKRYFGGSKGYLYWDKATIASQVLAGLGGPPDAIRRLDGNMAIASACRAHSCMEKAAVVIACPATIVAIGAIHYSPTSGEGWTDRPELTLFSDGSNQQAHDALKQWAAAALGDKFDGMPVHVRSPLQTSSRKR